MRVGELARRSGVGVSTLRAWERRFGLLTPERSESGQRLYAEDDVQRVVAVSRLVAEGLTVSAAAGRVAAAGAGALAVREGEADAFLLHQVLEAADRGIWVFRNGRTRFANRRMAELLGCSIDELMARPTVDFVDPSDLDLAKARGQKSRDGHRQRYDTQLRRADGSSFLASVSTTPLRDHGGAYQGAVAVVSDVTAARAAEAATHFRVALLDAIGDAVMAAEPDGTIVYANPAAERLLGWRATELIGQNGLELLPDDRDTATQIHSQLLTKTRQNREITLVHRDGTPFRARLTGSAVVDERGEIVGVIGVLRDNSERDTLQHELRSQRQQAETVALLGTGVLSDTSRDRDTALTEVVEAARRVLQADNAALLELAPGGEQLVVRLVSPDRGARPTIPAGSRSLAGYAVLAGAVVVVEDASLDRRFDLAAPPGVDITIASAIAAPVIGKEGVCGVLIASRESPCTFSQSAAHFMQSIANVAAVALQQPERGRSA